MKTRQYGARITRILDRHDVLTKAKYGPIIDVDMFESSLREVINEFALEELHKMGRYDSAELVVSISINKKI